MPRAARYSRIGNLLIAFASINCFSFTRFIGTVRGLTRRTGLEWFNNIYPRSGLNRPQGSIVEIGIVAVELILLDNHPLVLQKDFELLGLVDAERVTDGGIAALQPSDKRRIGNPGRPRRTTISTPRDVWLRRPRHSRNSWRQLSVVAGNPRPARARRRR